MLQHPNFKVNMESIQVSNIETKVIVWPNKIQHENDIENYDNNDQIGKTLEIYKRMAIE